MMVCRELQPELPGVRLGPGIGRPVIAHMLVFAGYLAAVAAIADTYVDNKCFHLVCSSFYPGIESQS